MNKISKEQLYARLGFLEFANDQLTSELNYADELLRSIGFPEGLETVKLAAQELKENEVSSEIEMDSDNEESV